MKTDTIVEIDLYSVIKEVVRYDEDLKEESADLDDSIFITTFLEKWEDYIKSRIHDAAYDIVKDALMLELDEY